MPSTKEVKRKIRSVNNIKKITRAMQMVSAAKLKKATERLNAIKPFVGKLQEILDRLCSSLPPEMITHPLLRAEIKAGRDEDSAKKNRAVIIVSSNKGLCGGYNTNLIKAASNFIEQQTNIQIIAMGTKCIDYFRRAARQAGKQDANFLGTYPQIPADLTDSTVKELVGPLLKSHQLGSVDEIWIVYTEFVNAMRFIPRVKRLVPFMDSEKSESTKKEDHKDKPVESSGADYIFEPAPELILEHLVPRYIQMMFYCALLEASASEHSARMMAMRNATENADEMIESLTLTYNKARQAGITKELLDIVGGAEAMK